MANLSQEASEIIPSSLANSTHIPPNPEKHNLMNDSSYGGLCDPINEYSNNSRLRKNELVLTFEDEQIQR